MFHIKTGSLATKHTHFWSAHASFSKYSRMVQKIYINFSVQKFRNAPSPSALFPSRGINKSGSPIKSDSLISPVSAETIRLCRTKTKGMNRKRKPRDVHPRALYPSSPSRALDNALSSLRGQLCRPESRLLFIRPPQSPLFPVKTHGIWSRTEGRSFASFYLCFYVPLCAFRKERKKNGNKKMLRLLTQESSTHEYMNSMREMYSRRFPWFTFSISWKYTNGKLFLICNHG